MGVGVLRLAWMRASMNSTTVDGLASRFIASARMTILDTWGEMPDASLSGGWSVSLSARSVASMGTTPVNI